jgi:hypothetical protein
LCIHDAALRRCSSARQSGAQCSSTASSKQFCADAIASLELWPVHTPTVSSTSCRVDLRLCRRAVFNSKRQRAVLQASIRIWPRGSGRAFITSPSVAKSRTHGSPPYLHTISRKSNERSNVQFGTASKATTRTGRTRNNHGIERISPNPHHMKRLRVCCETLAFPSGNTHC